MNPGFAYRQAAASGATPLRLVILLYEQAMEDLSRAISALKEGDIERRTREINHAILVLGHLQATLDKDAGGTVAANLDRFYSQVRQSLVSAQFQQSTAALEEQTRLLGHVHDAWLEVEKAAMPAAPSPDSNEPQKASSWSA